MEVRFGISSVRINNFMDEDVMECSICGKTFTRKGDLRRHMVNVHKDVNTELMAASGSEQQREKQIG